MKSKALVCDADRNFSIQDVALPDPGPEHLVLHTEWSGVSIGTEFACIQGKLDWGPAPMVTGYQAVGVVEAAGADTEGFAVGERVFWRLNRTIHAPDGSKITGAQGAHCAHAVVPANLGDGIGHLPEGVEPDVASLFVMPAVGLYGVDMSGPKMGDVVVVVGCGLIGLGVVAACAHRGCHVIATDLVPARLELARRMGAHEVFKADEVDVEAEVKKIAPDGADVVFESTGIPAMIDKSIPLCRTLGKFVWQGNYGNAPLEMHFLPAHMRRLTMFFPCNDGLLPCRLAVLHNMARGFLPWDETITHRITADEAPALYTRIDKGEADDLIGAVIRWSA